METPVLDFLQGPESTVFAIILALGIAFSGLLSELNSLSGILLCVLD